MNTLMDSVYTLASQHDIFISIEPKMRCWSLKFSWKIEEPIYDRHFGYERSFKKESGDILFNSYDEALSNAVEYAMTHTKLAFNGMLTLIEDYWVNE